MDEQASQPPQVGGEQRTLASIMFTDVVAFSKHSAVNEERTYRALNRDFDLIYKAVAEHEGQVLNTMGDGMMVIFMSPVQCMRCALLIQGELYRQSLNKPVDGVLQHRLGLHIGDIILNGKNTMGDGVNQAARIQALARPEAIAMSREFHNMVENKIPFTAKYLGPQRAKNIHDAIPIWEISPIDDMIRQQAAEALFTPTTSEASDGVTGRRSALVLLAVLVLVAFASALIFMVKTANQTKKQMAPGKSTQSEREAIARKLQGAMNGNNAPPQPTNKPNNPATKPTSLLLNATEVADIAAKTISYDYAGVSDILKKAIGADSDEGKAMIKKFDDLSLFKHWLETEVSAAKETAPLMGQLEGVPIKVYSTADGTMIDNGTPVVKSLWEFKPASISAVAEAAAAKPPSGTPLAPEATGWLSTFKEIHKVS
ncbi:MAG: adenylate/guanylate cyclase domain-containing protein [Armatimonadota bacterium]